MTLHIRHPLPTAEIEKLIDDALFVAPRALFYRNIAIRFLGFISLDLARQYIFSFILSSTKNFANRSEVSVPLSFLVTQKLVTQAATRKILHLSCELRFSLSDSTQK